jgi:hypothetical protein
MFLDSCILCFFNIGCYDWIVSTWSGASGYKYVHVGLLTFLYPGKSMADLCINGEEK